MLDLEKCLVLLILIAYALITHRNSLLLCINSFLDASYRRSLQIIEDYAVPERQGKGKRKRKSPVEWMAVQSALKVNRECEERLEELKKPLAELCGEADAEFDKEMVSRYGIRSSTGREHGLNRREDDVNMHIE